MLPPFLCHAQRSDAGCAATATAPSCFAGHFGRYAASMGYGALLQALFSIALAMMDRGKADPQAMAWAAIPFARASCPPFWGDAFPR